MASGPSYFVWGAIPLVCARSPQRHEHSVVFQDLAEPLQCHLEALVRPAAVVPGVLREGVRDARPGQTMTQHAVPSLQPVLVVGAGV